jgi:hypothetical protein
MPAINTVGRIKARLRCLGEESGSVRSRFVDAGISKGSFVLVLDGGIGLIWENGGDMGIGLI